MKQNTEEQRLEILKDLFANEVNPFKCSTEELLKFYEPKKDK